MIQTSPHTYNFSVSLTDIICLCQAQANISAKEPVFPVAPYICNYSTKTKICPSLDTTILKTELSFLTKNTLRVVKCIHHLIASVPHPLGLGKDDDTYSTVP